MAYVDGKGSATVFRSGIPGTDRHLYYRDGFPASELPLTWGRDAASAVADDGVWIGTGDSHEIEFVDWVGTTVRRIPWAGPADLKVTQEDMDLERIVSTSLTSSGGVPTGASVLKPCGNRTSPRCQPDSRPTTRSW